MVFQYNYYVKIYYLPLTFVNYVYYFIKFLIFDVSLLVRFEFKINLILSYLSLILYLKNQNMYIPEFFDIKIK